MRSISWSSSAQRAAFLSAPRRDELILCSSSFLHSETHKVKYVTALLHSQTWSGELLLPLKPTLQSLVQQVEVLLPLRIQPAVSAVSQLLLFLLVPPPFLHLQPGQPPGSLLPQVLHRLLGQPAPSKRLQTDHLGVWRVIYLVPLNVFFMFSGTELTAYMITTHTNCSSSSVMQNETEDIETISNTKNLKVQTPWIPEMKKQSKTSL